MIGSPDLVPGATIDPPARVNPCGGRLRVS
jgi:hypothetical protein